MLRRAKPRGGGVSAVMLKMESGNSKEYETTILGYPEVPVKSAA
jgi:hypothetical protein